MLNPNMIPLNAARPKTSGWRAELKRAFRTPGELLDWLGIDREGLDLSPDRSFPMLVPRAFAARMQPGDRSDPLLRQVLPLAAEQSTEPGFCADPVGDRASRAARGLLHKYRGRALLITTGACAVHCRYCFRRTFPYASDHAGPGHWHEALDYIRADGSLEEIILSGGDPLMLSSARLRQLTTALGTIGHVRRLRIHTRLPVVLPARVNAALADWLAGLPWPAVVVIHANHAREFDSHVDQALGRIRATGAQVLNQAVLLAGVNDDAGSLAELMRRAFSAGALPYYLHLLDRVSGSGQFEVAEPAARTLLTHLRTELSGYLVPKLVRESAGAPYKLPVY